MAADITRTIDALWRIESPRLIAGLARMVRDVGLAEELAQDALVIALERWPETGVPDNPGAWLMATAKNRAIDRLRRRKMAERKHAEIGREMEEGLDPTAHIEATLDDDIGDDLLGLIFPPATRSSPPRPGWRSRCESSGGSPLPRSRAPSGTGRPGPADRAGQADAREAGSVRGATGGRAGSGSPRCSR
jgi:hypothetical protein